METKDLQFSGKILDNVHGFIYYTEVEKKIMDTQLFKRLQSIKQLSVVNWIFPGSEHTRFIHSLGVMHIADRIAKQIGLDTNMRQVVRIAGLLHDIGHYPLSHVCEAPYKKDLTSYSAENYCKEVNLKVKSEIDSFNLKVNQEFMKPSVNGHHESIGTDIIRNNPELRQLIINECGEDAINLICDMIVGSVTREGVNPILVQILHSELDADGIDYLLRDSTFSGTSFGGFELEQLISNFEVGYYYDKPILCINPKGIPAADQYMLNKFFSYSQVVFNKHVNNLEWMAEHIVDWMQKQSAYFPSKTDLLDKWVRCEEGDFSKYLLFTDNFFWSALRSVLDSELKSCLPKFIVSFCHKLLNHEELEYKEDSEVRIVSKDSEEIKCILKQSESYKKINELNDSILIFLNRPMSKQVPEEIFLKTLDENIKKNNEDKIPNDIYEECDSYDQEDEEYRIDILSKRLMEGICVKDNESLHLLCDDKRSLMQELYNTNIVVLREFMLPK